MKDKVFLDTNILIYSNDPHDITKQKKARSTLNAITANDIGVISTQVLQEFYVTATKKLNADPLVVKEIIHRFENFEVIQITPEMINEAIDVSIVNKISFWDSLIIVSAATARCSSILTEDMNASQTIRGVKIINPF